MKRSGIKIHCQTNNLSDETPQRDVSWVGAKKNEGEQERKQGKLVETSQFFAELKA